MGRTGFQVSESDEQATVVFVVQHSRELDDDAAETKLVGVYSTEVAANQAIALLRSKPGFAKHPDDFSVDRYVLDRTHWADGFDVESEG